MTTKVIIIKTDDKTFHEYTFKCPMCDSDSIYEARHTDKERNVHLVVENHNTETFDDKYSDWSFVDNRVVYRCGNCHGVVATESPSHLVSAVADLVKSDLIKSDEREVDLDKLAWKKTCESNSKCITCCLYDYCSNHSYEKHRNL